MNKRGVIPAILVALVVTAAVRADLMPASPPAVAVSKNESADCRAPLAMTCCADLRRLFLSESAQSVDDLLLSLLRTDAQGSAEPMDETQPVHLLSDSQSSLALCLYGLLGFGALRSASWMKRLSFTLIPDWYHTGGPSQIGHSFAISPDCLCPAPVYCFVQPDGIAADCLPQYYRGTIESLWRRSQFTPTALASRGPPSLTN